MRLNKVQTCLFYLYDITNGNSFDIFVLNVFNLKHRTISFLIISNIRNVLYVEAKFKSSICYGIEP